MTPENILVAGNGAAKLVDFGIARRASSDLTGTSVGFLFGRYGYTAPEQAANPTDVSAVSDEWSLAAIVYETLTGLTPFRDVRDEQEPHPIENYMARLLNSPTPEDPEKLNPTISPELSGVILRALSQDVGQRFPTALAFAEALAGAPSAGVRLKATIVSDDVAPGRSPAGEVLSSMVISLGAEPHSGDRRLPRWAIGVAVLTLLGVAGAGGALWLRSSGRPAGSDVHPPRTAVGAAADPSPAAGSPEPDAGVRSETTTSLPDAGAKLGEAPAPPDASAAHPPAPPAPPKQVPRRRSHRPSEDAPRPPKKPDPATDREGILKI